MGIFSALPSTQTTIDLIFFQWAGLEKLGHADAFQPYSYSLWPFSMVGVETPPPPVNAYSDPPACIELKKVQMYLSLPEWMEWSKWKGQDGSWVFSVLSNWCKESKLLMRSKLKLLVKSKKILIKKLDKNINFQCILFPQFIKANACL